MVIKGNTTAWTPLHTSRLIWDNLDFCFVDIVAIVSPQGSLGRIEGKMTIHLGNLPITVSLTQDGVPVFGEQVQT
jgi:hypothetical protein